MRIGGKRIALHKISPSISSLTRTLPKVQPLRTSLEIHEQDQATDHYELKYRDGRGNHIEAVYPRHCITYKSRLQRSKLHLSVGLGSLLQRGV